MPKRIVISMLPSIALLIFFFPPAAGAHEDTASGNAGIVEKTGQIVPLDLPFLDEDCHPVTLRDLIAKPTILTLVYYSCSESCPLMLGALASAMGEVKLGPGKDYKIVTISIDKHDTPAIAKERKGDYIKASGIRFPTDAWRFLTGGEENISRLTKAVGFTYLQESGSRAVGVDSHKESEGFIHPTVLIFLAPDGRIIRYIYFGQSHYASLSQVSFSPTDLTLALTDAAKGKVRSGSIKSHTSMFSRHFQAAGSVLYAIVNSRYPIASLFNSLFYLPEKARWPYHRRQREKPQRMILIISWRVCICGQRGIVICRTI